METTNSSFNAGGAIPHDQSNEKTIAILTHLGGLFFAFVPALVVYLIKKDESAYLAAQAKEALNFQITIAIAMAASTILIVVLIGILLIWLVVLINMIFCIVAAVRAGNGELYRYPFSLRIIK